jgi:hypothetical protein
MFIPHRKYAYGPPRPVAERIILKWILKEHCCEDECRLNWSEVAMMVFCECGNERQEYAFTRI